MKGVEIARSFAAQKEGVFMRLGSWWDHASQTQTEELPLCQIESNPRTKAILCEQNKFEGAHKFAQHPCPTNLQHFFQLSLKSRMEKYDLT